MSKAKYISFASVISEIKQSDVFMSVKMRILETPKANLNGVSVTEAFIDNIIADEERYVGLPLYADIKSLLSGKYSNLGHMYNPKTGEFYSTQIGSFYQFEKEEFDKGSYLVGYARIPKRNKKLSKAIAELFAEDALKFSFEIACSDYTETEDGILVIDASENNYLEGTAIVTFPACEDAVALEFVAQREAGNTERGEMEMAEVDKLEIEQELENEQPTMAEVETEAMPEEQAETQPEEVAEQETETAEEKVEEDSEEKAEETETEDASCKKKNGAEEAETETAEIIVDNSTTIIEHTHAYDTETGTNAYRHVEITEGVTEAVEGNLVDTEEGVRIAEDPDPNGENTEVDDTGDDEDNGVGDDPEETEEDVPRTENDEEKKKIAEQMIAELFEKIKVLTEEIEHLKEQRLVAAADKINISAAAINPFVDSMTASNKSYLDLLQPAEKKNGRDLLTK